ncbi:Thioredoxin family protein [hydrothermal vent metagenome]|uniref:Thioredoxin family protein n=1 Tax=hydrothermal vent metagenome TaxID=652676 RepID=A0A3B0XR98_9ZZZZ
MKVGDPWSPHPTQVLMAFLSGDIKTVHYLYKKHSALALLVAIVFSNTAFAAKAPAFSLKGDNGKVELSTYQGQVVYVDFWASWCKPCRKSFPFMNNMERKYAKKGLKIIAINMDSKQADAGKFLKKNPAKFTIAYDPDGKTANAYKLRVMPTSYIIDRKGNITFTHKGFKPGQVEELEKLIVQTLNKK